mgnify:CR=1 FL=1
MVLKLYKIIKNKLIRLRFFHLIRLYKIRKNNKYYKNTIFNKFDKKSSFIIHIPKTAGTSVTKSIYGTDTKCSHYNWEDLNILLKENFFNYFSFTIVRNPWDRLVSQYFGHVIKEMPGLSIDNYFLRSFVYDEYHDYKRFVQPCMDWITDDGNILVDHIIRFENLQDDFNVVCDKIGVEHIDLTNEGKSKKLHYRNYYSDYTAELIYNKFRTDIEEFGYEF